MAANPDPDYRHVTGGYAKARTALEATVSLYRSHASLTSLTQSGGLERFFKANLNGLQETEYETLRALYMQAKENADENSLNILWIEIKEYLKSKERGELLNCLATSYRNSQD